ncbi:MAG: TIGR03013 family PEP-CTERM/XrtA system glycosyltransferase [Alphaproteobacteria bacterium]
MIRLFRHYIAGSSIFLGTIEALVLLCLAQVLLTTQIDPGFLAATGDQLISYFGIFLALLCVVILSSLGLYNRDVMANRRLMLIRLSFGFVIIALVIYALTQLYLSALSLDEYPPSYMLVLAIAGAITLLLFTRLLFLTIADVAVFRRRVLVIGAGQRAKRLLDVIPTNRNNGFEIVGFVAIDDEDPLLQSTARIPRGDISAEQLWDEIDRFDADEIVVAPDNRRGLPVRALLNCKLKGLRVTEFLTFVEREVGKISLSELDPSWLIFSDGFRVSLSQDVTKRVVDVVVSTLFLLFTLPIMAMTAIMIRFDSPGPIFYRQDRVGRDAKVYTLLKFRSMKVDAEASSGPRWAAADDDRITAVGNFIRKTRLDEIPQVINVLRGEMSFIGPRPERPFFVESLCEAVPYYSERHRVKPGITGWAQVCYPYGASIEDAKEKLAYDLYYIKNRSLFLDIIILLQTVRVVLWPGAAGVR